MNDYSASRIKKEPMRFVSDLVSKPSVTLEELLAARRTIQNCADETSTQLKKNVYKNYQLFIDTSKEVSYLKSEMSQLSSFLNEEYKLLETLLSISIGGSKTGLTASEKKEALEKFKEDRERRMLQMSQAANLSGPLPTKEFRSIVDHIEGGAGMLENRHSSLVYCDGEVIELDENYQELQNHYLVLLNDALIITTVQPENRKKFVAGQSVGISYAITSVSSPGRRYKFVSIIDLESIAVVNVKDRRYSKYEMAFKLLMSTASKVFLTSSLNKKKVWIEAFEAAKKYLRSSNRLQRRDSSLYISSSTHQHLNSAMMSNFDSSSKANSVKTLGSSTGSNSYSQCLNPFDEPELEQDGETDSMELPYWLAELPDDLDVYIAQRNFEDAVKLITRAMDHFFHYSKWSDNQMQVDLKLKIDNKINELVEVLSGELNVPPDRSLQTGPRASRRAVSLLVRLGRSSLAIQLFLEQRKRLLKYYFRQQKTSIESSGHVTGSAAVSDSSAGSGGSSTVSFMRRMTNLFFGHFIETSKEFLRAFEIVDQSLTMNTKDHHDSTTDQSSLGLSNLDQHRKSFDENSGDVDNHGGNSNNQKSSSMNSYTALACLNSWIYEEFVWYLELFPRHVFIQQVNTQATVECIHMAIYHCQKLRQTLGVDLLFVFSKNLKQKIDMLIDEINSKFMETIKLRAGEEKLNQYPKSFESRSKLNKFLNELTELGCDVSDFVLQNDNNGGSGNKYLVELTVNMCSFTKSYLNTIKNLLKLAHNPYSIKLINKGLIQAFQWQMNHYASCLKNHYGKVETHLIKNNIQFMLDRLVPVVIRKYGETVINSVHVRSFQRDLQNVSLDFAYLKEKTFDTTPQAAATTTISDQSYQSLSKMSPIPTPRTRKANNNTNDNNNYHSSTVTTTNTTDSTNKSYTMGTYL